MNKLLVCCVILVLVVTTQVSPSQCPATLQFCMFLVPCCAPVLRDITTVALNWELGAWLWSIWSCPHTALVSRATNAVINAVSSTVFSQRPLPPPNSVPSALLDYMPCSYPRQAEKDPKTKPASASRKAGTPRASSGPQGSLAPACKDVFPLSTCFPYHNMSPPIHAGKCQVWWWWRRWRP